jgi:hypothetical protein
LKRNDKFRIVFITVYLVIAAFVFCCSSLLAQPGSEVIVAETGRYKITASEFIRLYELSPHINIDSNDPLMKKVNFLNTLIAYKLWYQNKETYRLDTSAAFNTAVKELRKMFVRDALYRQEISGKVKISPAEMAGAKVKQRKILAANYIFTDNEDESSNLLSLLNSGIPFDSLFSAREEFAYQKEPLEIKFGDYNELAEEQLYSLRAGEYSSVLHFRDGYYIFFIKNIKTDPGKEEDIYRKAEDVLKRRKKDILYDTFMKSVLNGVKADADGRLFKALVAVLTEEFKKGIAKDSLISLTTGQYAAIENRFSKEELDSPFISFSEDTVSLDEFLHSVFFSGIKMSGADSIAIVNGLNIYVKDFISKEVIYRAGEKKGLAYLPGVQEDLQLWSEFYAFEAIRGSMLDTVHVSTGEITAAYRQQYKDNLTGNMSYSEAEPLIRERIANQKIKSAITQKTAEFVKGTTIKINYDVLEKIELTEINSFTMRNLGFGGTITGVPLYSPNYEWADADRVVNQVP